MRYPHRLLAVALCCAALAWLAGPPGRLLIMLPLLLFGPGYLLERALVPFPSPSLALRPALWLGLSLSIVALLYEWTTAIGLSLASPALYALAAFCGLGVIWRVLREATNDQRPTTNDKETRRQGDKETETTQRTTDNRQRTIHPSSFILHPSSLGLLAILALTLWTRFVQIKDLALPAWVDSLHHALMIRVAAEQGRVPYSLRPYLPIDQLPYHWGYHVFTAASMQLAGLSLGQAMLWVGQVLNALHVLTVAALAAFLWRRPLAGVVAGLVVGLLSIMPAYYVSWGRYTQLSGLLLFPPLAITWHAGLRAPSRGRCVCLAVLLAGLSLIHIRVLIFALTFMAVSGAVWLAHTGAGLWRSRIRYAAVTAALALALAAPWLWVLGAQMLLPALARPQALVAEGAFSGLTGGLLWAGHNRLLIALALSAALWGIARRSRIVVEQLGWVAGMGLLANPVFIGLPYLWLITNDVIAISLFIPIGVLLGGGACMLLEWLEKRRPTTDDRRPTNDERRTTTDDQRQGDKETSRQGGGESETQNSKLNTQNFSSILHPPSSILYPRRLVVRCVGAVALGALALWGAWDIRSVINPDTILATEADVAASTWVGEHTPADARFLINTAPWLTIHRGTDGGWWLLPLAGRWVSTPPALYPYGPPDYAREIRELDRQIADFRPGQEEQLYQLIERQRITYIYLGPRAGPLSLAAFAGDTRFEKVYERDGVTILAVHHRT